MPITYTKQSHTKRLIEPLFSKFRQKYRGTRDSKKENLEMNSLIADFNRINNQLNLINSTCDDRSEVVNGKIFSIVQEDIFNDGVDLEIGGVTASAVNKTTSNATNININDVVKITGKLARLKNKIKFLEDKV